MTTTHATWGTDPSGYCGCVDCTAPDDASLGVGHIWTAVSCPAYRTLDGADCTCNDNERK